MNAKKMLVVYLTGTKAVLGVATRRAAGAPPVADLVGTALPVRALSMESGVAVAAGDLSVKEVDYGGDVLRQPLNYSLDASGAVIVVTPTISGITGNSANIAITLSAPVAADKSVIVVVDAGASREPLKFAVKTTATSLSTVNVPVTGVPPGSHDVFASVEGYVSALGTGSFS